MFEVQPIHDPTSRIGSLEHVASTCCARVLTHVEHEDTEHHQGNSGAGAPKAASTAATLTMTMTMMMMVAVMIGRGGGVEWVTACLITADIASEYVKQTILLHYISTPPKKNVMVNDGYQIPVVLGSGGSFKDRKPIGEVGCCESRMAERIHRWTERWLELRFLDWLQWLQRSPHHNCWM